MQIEMKIKTKLFLFSKECTIAHGVKFGMVTSFQQKKHNQTTHFIQITVAKFRLAYYAILGTNKTNAVGFKFYKMILIL